MNIYFIFSGGRRKRWINKKYSPSEFFYGFKELSSINEKISFLEERDIGMMPKKSILSIFFRKLSFFSYNIPLEMIYGFLKTIKSLPFSDKDIIVSTTNGIGLTLAFAKKLGILKSNLIFIAMGLIPKNSAKVVVIGNAENNVFICNFLREFKSFPFIDLCNLNNPILNCC